MLRRLRVGAHERVHRVRGERLRPQLLAVHDVLVAVAHGAALQRGEVGAAAGLGVALRPVDLAGRDRRHVLGLLLLRAVDHEQRAEEHRARPADAGCAGALALLVEDELLERGEAGAAEVLRPGGGDVALGGERLRPLVRGALDCGVLGVAVVPPVGAGGEDLLAVGGADHVGPERSGVLAVALGQVFLEEGSHLRPELRLLGAVCPVHRTLPPWSPPWSGRMLAPSRTPRRWCSPGAVGQACGLPQPTVDAAIRERTVSFMPSMKSTHGVENSWCEVWTRVRGGYPS